MIKAHRIFRISWLVGSTKRFVLIYLIKQTIYCNLIIKSEKLNYFGLGDPHPYWKYFMTWSVLSIESGSVSMKWTGLVDESGSVSIELSLFSFTRQQLHYQNNALFPNIIINHVLIDNLLLAEPSSSMPAWSEEPSDDRPQSQREVLRRRRTLRHEGDRLVRPIVVFNV